MDSPMVYTEDGMDKVAISKELFLMVTPLFLVSFAFSLSVAFLLTMPACSWFRRQLKDNSP